MKKICILISITLHVCLIYWLFTTAIPIANFQVKEKVITVVPIAPNKIIFYTPEARRFLPTPATPQPKPMPASTSKLSVGETSVSVPSRKANQPEQEGKEILRPDPTGKIPTAKETDLRQYLSSYEHPYGDPRLRKGLGGRSGDTENPNLPREDNSYKQPTGRIDFDVPGLNIKPWVKQTINKIQLNWEIPAGIVGYSHTSLSVGIKVTIEKSGALSLTEINRSSLIEEIDRAALAALKTSAPFSPLPSEFPENRLEAYLLFNIRTNE